MANSSPFVSTAITRTHVEEVDKTLESKVTKDTGLPVPGAAAPASTVVPGISVAPAPGGGGGVIIAASTAAGSGPVEEIDTTSPTQTTKVTDTTTTVTTSPATTNQYEHAAWSLADTDSVTILSLQMLGVSATYMALYRVTNDSGYPVTLNAGQSQATLQPGTSMDVSAQQVSLTRLNNQPAFGSYQNLCCGTISQAQAQGKVSGGAPVGGITGTGGGGGGLIDLGGGDDDGGFPGLTFPDPASGGDPGGGDPGSGGGDAGDASGLY